MLGTDLFRKMSPSRGPEDLLSDRPGALEISPRVLMKTPG